jgi:hypothetical protein
VTGAGSVLQNVQSRYALKEQLQAARQHFAALLV